VEVKDRGKEKWKEIKEDSDYGFSLLRYSQGDKRYSRYQ